MTYSRSVTVLCFIVVMLIAALTPIGVPGPTTVEADRVTETVATTSRPATGWNLRGEETLMRMRHAALAAPFVLAAAVAATLLLTSNVAARSPTPPCRRVRHPRPATRPPLRLQPQPPDRCTTPTDPTCILAVYKGAPDDYAQVQDIPDSVLIQPDDDGRYQVERGQRITVVTAAQLPSGYTSFFLQRRPLQATVRSTSHERLIAPSGTTYTFTVTTDEAASNLISFDLTAARPRPGQKPELGDIVVTTNFLVPTLRYDTLDITGAATTPGSYAFLDTAGDASSAIGNYGSSAQATVELRIHPIDASGASRADFYDTVQIGHSFDYRTNGLDCGFRFTVTSIAAAASTRTLGLEYVNRYGGNCGGPVTDPGAAKAVYFVWRVPHGVPAPDGVQLLLPGEPAGKGTYRLYPGVRYVIDVPAGGLIVLKALYEMARDPDRPPTSRVVEFS